MNSSFGVHFVLLCIFALFYKIETVKIGLSQKPNNATYDFSHTITTTTESAITTTAIPTETSLTTTQTTASTLSNTTTTARNLPTFPPKKTRKQLTIATTQAPSTTAATFASNNETALDVQSQTKIKIETVKWNNYYCFCNLLTNVCDINCCCDIDCPKDALKVFDCFVQPTYKEFKHRLEDFNYQHGLASCKISDGWLCVFRANVKTKDEYIPENLDTTDKPKWPNMLVTANEEQATNDVNYYKYGDPLQIANVLENDIRYIDIPSPLLSAHCEMLTPIKHLKSESTSCLFETLEDAQENRRNLQRILMESKLLSKPYKQSNMDQETIYQNMKELILRSCVKVHADSLEETCIDLSHENATLDNENLPLEFVFTIWHNYTHVWGGNIDFKELKLDNIELPRNFEFWLKYTVQYIALPTNITAVEYSIIDNRQLSTATRPVSGPLGYLQGEPVIVANYVASNVTQEYSIKNRIISYFHPSYTNSQLQHTIKLFTIRHNHCYKSALRPMFVNFGINTLKECSVRFENESALYTRTDNFTLICTELQNLIFGQLFDVGVTDLDTLSELLISELGKPLNDSTKWLPLQVRNAEFAPIMGQYNEETETFTCRNIIISAAYEFVYGTYTLHNIPHQALIKHASLILGQRLDLEFTLSEVLEVPLTMSVMFYNLNDAQHFGKSQGVPTKLYIHSFHSYIKYFTVFLIALIYNLRLQYI